MLKLEFQKYNEVCQIIDLNYLVTAVNFLIGIPIKLIQCICLFLSLSFHIFKTAFNLLL